MAELPVTSRRTGTSTTGTCGPCGGVGVLPTPADELQKALAEPVASGKPTLINAVIDETAGTESGRITSLNPAMAKKKAA